MEAERISESPPAPAEIELHLSPYKNHPEETDGYHVAPQNAVILSDYQTKTKPSLLAEDFRQLSISPAPSGRLSRFPMDHIIRREFIRLLSRRHHLG